MSIPTQRLVLAERLRTLRRRQGLSLQDVATMSGVSRAALSRIENAEVSPTAETLGALATAYRSPMSQLLAPLEERFQAVVRRDAQSVWTDDAVGFERRSVSPRSGPLSFELLRCALRPDARIAYAAPAILGQEHHLALLDGRLTVTIERDVHALEPGDCLRYVLHGASAFHAGAQGARYVLAIR